MISLSSPITVDPPNMGILKLKKVTLDSIDYTVTYDNTRRRAIAIIKKIGLPLVLWEGDDYDSVGQFTDEDVENRVEELIGPNYAQGIKLMYCK